VRCLRAEHEVNPSAQRMAAQKDKHDAPTIRCGPSPRAPIGRRSRRLAASARVPVTARLRHRLFLARPRDVLPLAPFAHDLHHRSRTPCGEELPRRRYADPVIADVRGLVLALAGFRPLHHRSNATSPSLCSFSCAVPGRSTVNMGAPQSPFHITGTRGV
jgi:hypothetical protein